VNELTFRRTSSAPTGTGHGYLAGLPIAPATQGKGFLFSNISYGVTDSALPGPTNPPTPASAPTSDPDEALSVAPTTLSAAGPVSVSAQGFQPGEDVAVIEYPEAAITGWLTADFAGTVSGDVAVPTSAAAGTHQLQLTGAASGCTAVGAFQLTAR